MFDTMQPAADVQTPSPISAPQSNATLAPTSCATSPPTPTPHPLDVSVMLPADPLAGPSVMYGVNTLPPPASVAPLSGERTASRTWPGCSAPNPAPVTSDAITIGIALALGQHARSLRRQGVGGRRWGDGGGGVMRWEGVATGMGQPWHSPPLVGPWCQHTHELTHTKPRNYVYMHIGLAL